MYISKGDLMVYDHLQMGFHGIYGIYIYTYILAGGLEHFSFYDFAFSWEWNNHSNWRTPSFFRGVGIPSTRKYGKRKNQLDKKHYTVTGDLNGKIIEVNAWFSS